MLPPPTRRVVQVLGVLTSPLHPEAFKMLFTKPGILITEDYTDGSNFSAVGYLLTQLFFKNRTLALSRIKNRKLVAILEHQVPFMIETVRWIDLCILEKESSEIEDNGARVRHFCGWCKAHGIRVI